MVLNYKGTSIYYSKKGTGKAIVLLHGFLESSLMWNDIVAEVSKNHQVICIDLLGHGHSGCIGYIHTMEQMAEAVGAVLNHIKIEKHTIIGHSMGGYVALAYIAMYPKKVEGLCLMNSTALEDNLEKQKNRDRAIIAVKHNHKTFIRLSIANLFRPKNRTIYSDEIKKIVDEAIQIPVQGIVGALEGMKIRKNRVALFRKSNFKKLLIIGRKDPVLDYTIVLSQAKDSNIEVFELPDGHMSYIENKYELTYKIMQFIEK
jgi:pimeloyl-ACP methyl ester carboxylesterase